jgi:hypothetical protein
VLTMAPSTRRGTLAEAPDPEGDPVRPVWFAGSVWFPGVAGVTSGVVVGPWLETCRDAPGAPSAGALDRPGTRDGSSAEGLRPAADPGWCP